MTDKHFYDTSLSTKEQNKGKKLKTQKIFKK